MGNKVVHKLSVATVTFMVVSCFILTIRLPCCLRRNHKTIVIKQLFRFSLYQTQQRQQQQPAITGSTQQNLLPASSTKDIATSNPLLLPGGRFRPQHCLTPNADRIAIVIPYRNRDAHLRVLLFHLHPILQRQQLDYQIFVVEQIGNGRFNKALLMNAAYMEAQKLGKSQGQKFGCFIFHDVDLLLEDERGIYECQEQPVHLSEYIDKYNYRPFRTQASPRVLFGGVVAIRSQLFELVNGYSNAFFGWGGEDDEMEMRLRLHKINAVAKQQTFYRFKMFRHRLDGLNPVNTQRFYLLSKTGERMWYDGLNSLRYRLAATQTLPSHMLFQVDVNERDVYDTILNQQKETPRKKASSV